MYPGLLGLQQEKLRTDAQTVGDTVGNTHTHTHTHTHQSPLQAVPSWVLGIPGAHGAPGSRRAQPLAPVVPARELVHLGLPRWAAAPSRLQPARPHTHSPCGSRPPALDPDLPEPQPRL